MFDFFRDMYFESIGIDADQMEKERQLKRDKKRKERFIFSKGMKGLVYFLAVLYLLMGGFGIAVKKQMGEPILVDAIIFIFLAALCFATMILLAIGKKKGEIASLILIFLFIVVQYFSTIMMM